MCSGALQTVLKCFSGNIDEIKFSALFVSAVTVNKYVLSELRFTVPTVFQGWQTFTCVVLLTVLIKFRKSSEEVCMLDRRNFYFLLPGFVLFATGIVAGSKGLSVLPVPVFCSVLSLHPAILILLGKKADFGDDSKRVCGCVAICGTVVVTLVVTLEESNVRGYLWLFGHVLLAVLYAAYTARMDLEMNDSTKIYYRNLFSVVVLLPISIYLDVLSLPKDFNWRFYLGCILSGVLGTFLQMSAAKLEAKSSAVTCQGRARLLCAVVAHQLFADAIQPVVWFLILINLFINSWILSSDGGDSDCEKKPKLTFLVGPPHGRDLYSDKTVCV